MAQARMQLEPNQARPRYIIDRAWRRLSHSASNQATGARAPPCHESRNQADVYRK